MLHQLLHQISRYLSGQCTVQDLEAWVVYNLQNILDSKDTQAIQLANQVDADLVRLGEQLIDGSTLRTRLESHLAFHETIRLTQGLPHDATTVSTTAVETVQVSTHVMPTVEYRLKHQFA